MLWALSVSASVEVSTGPTTFRASAVMSVELMRVESGDRRRENEQEQEEKEEEEEEAR